MAWDTNMMLMFDSLHCFVKVKCREYQMQVSRGRSDAPFTDCYILDIHSVVSQNHPCVAYTCDKRL